MQPGCNPAFEADGQAPSGAAQHVVMRRISLFLDPRPSARTPVGTPAAGGMVLGAAGIALAGYGLRRRSLLGKGLALVGGGIAYSGLSGMNPARRLVDPRTITRPFPALPNAAPIRASGEPMVRRAATIARSADAVQALLTDPAALAAALGNGPVPWRDAGQADAVPGDRLHWRIAGPLGMSFDVSLTPARVEGDQATWQVIGGPMDGAELRLSWRERPAPHGTELQASLGLPEMRGKQPPGPVRDAAGTALTRFLARVASLVEAGTLATTHGQTSGREDPGPGPFEGSPAETAVDEPLATPAGVGS
jgi:hypothetical protein